MGRTALTLMLIFSVAACGITGPETVTLRFEGTVTAQATGQPVAGAQILLVEPTFLGIGGVEKTRGSSITDSQGRYSLTGQVDAKCVGSYFGIDVRVNASGFTTDARNVGQCNGALQRFDFVLAPAASP